MIVLRAVQDGLLSLDADITAAIPDGAEVEVNPAAKTITLL